MNECGQSGPSLSESTTRIGAAPTCNRVFVDVSRGGRRRYCMPDLCGNRINAADHRQRRNALGDK
ncbi:MULTISPECIES: CGNR zinc finger domain-containing protein [unclassified Rhodococcus (in: high G+C Gram-positive bacteria)]|uniref:CGNR zinc finger domain-containing protein n=1 Tax=unclassified Rhodococcus (in: high G+C Gram-positive bacteria) TaxID=192944 RepID=UPI0007BC08DE|nr:MULTISPECIES: CGNR zinc finger domain-containing protein [unclassified Rhodococcus (in: high G+C Gram-positive bacteria)]KZF07597.1 hypothetical protein A2J04_02860 [Rhodococcus sp. EPR-279]